MIYIKDEEFIRGNCPMTKEEIRILSTAKLELKEDYKVIDIGAGTGSVSIQISKICKSGSVIAIERDSEAIGILKKNIEKFQATNVKIIEEEALAIEENITGSFDGIFIGGSGGNIEEIIIKYSEKLKKGGKIVLNFITIDNLYRAMSILKKLEFETECTQVAVSKTKGNGYMIFANNPIFILSGRK